MQKYIYSETRGGLVPDEPGNNTDAVPYTGGWYRAEEVARLTAEVERLREAICEAVEWDSDSFVDTGSYENHRTEYRCSFCGTGSEHDAGCPIPVLRAAIAKEATDAD